MAFDCMEDCIHLKACRRVQAIGKRHRLLVPRYCTEECTAYVSENEVARTVAGFIQGAFRAGENGCDSYRADKDAFLSMLRGEE